MYKSLFFYTIIVIYEYFTELHSQEDIVLYVHCLQYINVETLNLISKVLPQNEVESFFTL